MQLMDYLNFNTERDVILITLSIQNKCGCLGGDYINDPCPITPKRPIYFQHNTQMLLAVAPTATESQSAYVASKSKTKKTFKQECSELFICYCETRTQAYPCGLLTVHFCYEILSQAPCNISKQSLLLFPGVSVH